MKRGASVTGYGLVVGLIAVVAIGAVSASGQQVETLFTGVSQSLQDVGGAGQNQGSPVNDAPSVTVGTVPPSEAGSGLQTLPGFAVFDPGPGEAGQGVAAYILVETADADSAVSGASVDNSGTLTYTPDNAGTASFSLTVRDDGGTADGGVDTSDPVTFSITVTAAPAGIGPCSDDTPEAGEEGCDPGDGTIFVGLFDSDLDSTSERLFVTAYDLNSSGGLMTDPVGDRGLFYYMDSNDVSSTLDCVSSSTSSIPCSDGLVMTANLLADSANIFPAAEQCNSLSVDGHSDWYLPSLNELKQMHDNLALLDVDANSDLVGDNFNFYIENGSFPVSFYWPSSSRPGAGYYIRFSDNTVFDGRAKFQRAGVRCMRRTG